VIDIRESHDPRVVGSVNISRFAYGLAVSKTTAFVALRSVDYPYVYSLQAIDVTIPALPRLAGRLDLLYGAGSVALSGKYAYVVAFDLQIVDVSDPFNLRLAGILGAPGSWGGITVSGDIAYAAMAGSVVVIDVSNPRYPRFVGSAPSGGGDVAVSGEYLYAASLLQGLLVLPTHCHP
jgi:hypothetical protein